MVRPHQPQQALVPEYTSGAPPIMVAGNVSHSVAFWPEAAAAERSVLSVLGDADHVRFWLGSDLPYSAEAAQVAPPCVYSALTGVRVRNVELALATTREHSPVDGHLVFDPEHGPGEYEVYSHCSEHDHQPSDLAWRTAIPHASAVTSMPAALLIRREARNAILGPAWHEPPYGGYGASRRSLGNVRARLLVTAADARARAVRALIPWRRRHRPLGTQIYLYHEKGSAQHGAPRSYGDGSYRYYVKEAGRVENVALLVDGRESAEVLFEPTHGPGEYDLYYLPHQTKWQTYDARDDAHGTSYEAYQPTFDEAWHRVHARSAARLPVVRVFDVQARTHSDRFGDMERPATSAELASMLSSAVMGAKAAAEAASVTAAAGARRRLRVPGGDTRAPPSRTPRWHLFPESRAHVLRTMGKTLDPRLGPACICSLRRPLLPTGTSCELPERWARRGPAGGLHSQARLGEFYVWQVGVLAPETHDVRVLDCGLASASWYAPRANVAQGGTAAAAPTAAEEEHGAGALAGDLVGDLVGDLADADAPEGSSTRGTRTRGTSTSSGGGGGGPSAPIMAPVSALPLNTSAVRLHCFHTHGVGYDGVRIRMQPLVRRGCVRSLWLGVQLPSGQVADGARRRGPLDFESSASGRAAAAQALSSTLELSVRLRLRTESPSTSSAAADADAFASSVPSSSGAVGAAGPDGAAAVPPPADEAEVLTRLHLSLQGPSVTDAGDSRRWRLSRLRWLDSTAGSTPALPQPFVPVSAVSIEPGGEGTLEKVAAWVDAGIGTILGTAHTAPALMLGALMGGLEIGSGGLPTQLFAGRTPAEQPPPTVGSASGAADACVECHTEPAAAESPATAPRRLARGSSCIECPDGSRALLQRPISFNVRVLPGGDRRGASRSTANADDNSREVGGAERRPGREAAVEDRLVQWRVATPSRVLSAVEAAASTAPWAKLEALNAAPPSAIERVRWAAQLHSSVLPGTAWDVLTLDVYGEWWFDSQALITLSLSAPRTNRAPVSLTESELLVDLDAEIARYLMGFGKPARALHNNTPLAWHWAAGLGNYMAWLGDVRAGVRVRLVGETSAFESAQHLMSEADLPEGWHNRGRGGVRIDGQAALRAHGGARTMLPGSSVQFRFELLLTPCKPLNTAAHWAQRYYQVGYPDTRLIEPEDVANSGATVLNIHQGVDGPLNPYINYPFSEHSTAAMGAYVARAHARQLRVKAYYTVCASSRSTLRTSD